MRRQYPGNLASSFSASALGDDPLAFIRETQSSRGSGAGDKHCAFAVDEDMSDTRANEVSIPSYFAWLMSAMRTRR